MRNFIQFLKSKAFRIHFAIALGSIALLLFIVFKWLNIYTRHAETISVPDLKGIEIVEAMDLLDQQGFKYVIDSIYTELGAPNTVYEQEPEANALVKENRTIYLTIVSGSAPTVKLPDDPNPVPAGKSDIEVNSTDLFMLNILKVSLIIGCLIFNKSGVVSSF